MSPKIMLFISAIINTGITLILIIYWYFLYKKSKTIDKEIEKKQKEAEEFVLQARKTALKKIEETKLFTHKMQKEVKQAIIKSIEDYKELSNIYYQKLMEEFKQENKKALEKIQQKNLEALNVFTKNLENDTKSVKKEALKTIKNSLKVAQQEIDEYKQKAKTQFKKRLFKRVDEVILKVLAKNIPTETHQQIVKEALEEAKKSGFFK